MKKLMIALMVGGLIAPFVSACQNATPQQKIVAELGVEVAVIRYIGEDAGKAERVLAATKAIRLALEQDEVTTVSELTDVVLVYVETANPTEQAFLRAAVALALEDLQVVLPTGGLLDGLARDRVLTYLDAVDRAAFAVLDTQA